MKILKLGNKIVYTCPQCGAQLEIEDSDWVHRQTGINESETYVKCPCCSYELLQDKVINNIIK